MPSLVSMMRSAWTQHNTYLSLYVNRALFRSYFFKELFESEFAFLTPCRTTVSIKSPNHQACSLYAVERFSFRHFDQFACLDDIQSEEIDRLDSI